MFVKMDSGKAIDATRIRTNSNIQVVYRKARSSLIVKWGDKIPRIGVAKKVWSVYKSWSKYGLILEISSRYLDVNKKAHCINNASISALEDDQGTCKWQKAAEQNPIHKSTDIS